MGTVWWVTSLIIPVHGELSYQGNVCIVSSRLELIVQEVQVGSVNSEAFSPEFIAQVILIQLCQLLLKLQRKKKVWREEEINQLTQEPACSCLSFLCW